MNQFVVILGAGESGVGAAILAKRKGFTCLVSDAGKLQAPHREELKQFDKAIEVLENMRPQYPNPDFLDLRISRLKERQYNQPGAQGWKR